MLQHPNQGICLNNDECLDVAEVVANEDGEIATCAASHDQDLLLQNQVHM
jgi:hypothetical protein